MITANPPKYQFYFYAESVLGRGFARTKTIISRRFKQWHLSGLENLVRKVFEELKNSSALCKEC